MNIHEGKCLSEIKLSTFANGNRSFADFNPFMLTRTYHSDYFYHFRSFSFFGNMSLFFILFTVLILSMKEIDLWMCFLFYLFFTF